MKHTLPFAFLLLAGACQTTGRPKVVTGDEAVRNELFNSVSALEGTWQRTDPTGAISLTEFSVSSGGTVVQEVMFPGTEHEMRNMYSLDGDGLVMTHYCAGGNQPTMRAEAMVANTLPFRFESVRDLNAADESYMGEMTLVFLADGSVEQRWYAMRDGERDPGHEMTFTLKR